MERERKLQKTRELKQKSEAENKEADVEARDEDHKDKQTLEGQKK